MLKERADHVSVYTIAQDTANTEKEKNTQSSLDTLGGSNGEQRFCNTGAEAGQDSSRPRELAVLVDEQALELIKSNKT